MNAHWRKMTHKSKRKKQAQPTLSYWGAWWFNQFGNVEIHMVAAQENANTEGVYRVLMQKVFPTMPEQPHLVWVARIKPSAQPEKVYTEDAHQEALMRWFTEPGQPNLEQQQQFGLHSMTKLAAKLGVHN